MTNTDKPRRAIDYASVWEWAGIDLEAVSLLDREEVRRITAEYHLQRRAEARADMEEWSTWMPGSDAELIDRLLAGEEPENLPSIVPIDGSGFLLYSGQVHSIAGESGSGKSWLAMHAASQVLAEPEGRVLYFDIETNRLRTYRRMLALGVEPDILKSRFGYAHPTEHITTEEALALYDDVQKAVHQGEAVLVVIDSAGEGISLAGINPDSDEVAQWIRDIPRRLSSAGATVLMIDHVTKASANGKATYAIGSQRKRAAIDVQFMLDTRFPFSAAQAGSAKLRVSKDRDGNFSPGSVLAEMYVTPRDGQVQIALKAAETSSETSADNAKWALWQRISQAVEQSSPVSGNQVAQVVGNRPLVLAAIKDMEAAGYLARVPGKGLYCLAPFRANHLEECWYPPQPASFSEALALPMPEYNPPINNPL